jgi:hypothetical protein
MNVTEVGRKPAFSTLPKPPAELSLIWTHVWPGSGCARVCEAPILAISCRLPQCPNVGENGRSGFESQDDERSRSFSLECLPDYSLGARGRERYAEAVIASVVELIEGGEEARGPITRAQRARLAPDRARAQELLAAMV